MFDRDIYRKYKQDTNRLVYWMIRSTNAIPAAAPASAKAGSTSEGNTCVQQLHRFRSPKITVNGILLACEAIKANIGDTLDAVPSTVFRLFRSVIAARSQAYSFFNKITSETPDPQIEKDNAKHKAFLDALEKAFKILGGEEWLKSKKPSVTKDQMQEEEDNLFSNMFAKLSISKDYDSDEEENDENQKPDTSASTQTKPRAQPRPGKGKKSKKAKAKKSKSKGTTTSTQVTDTEFEDFPIEAFRIIDDESGEITDYLLAVYAWFRQSMALRNYLQELWWKVATGKVNSAVAGALSEVAIAKVKQLQAEIISEFGLHHGNFDTLANTITRGNPEKACSNFRVALFQVPNDPRAGPARMVNSNYIDAKEGFFLHAYWDLLAFILDWQATRSGKPTKKMLKELNKWDPNLDLRKVSKEERVQWRRQYTINWLYDLISVYSSIAVQRKHRGMPIVYDREDWSADGKYKEHRRLYGLNRFAGEVTALAMSKLDVQEIKKRILPHTVFELQLIVDSWTSSRGWTHSLMNGHVLKAPPSNFQPTRDVDMFLDKDKKLDSFRGFVPSVDIFVQLIDKTEFTAGNQGRTNELHKILLPTLSEDFICWLGSSKLAYGLNDIPPTRFASTNPNGLWAYSPYLNGVGLAEALDITFQYGMFTWDSQPEPMLTIHLHNMLAKLGYLKREVGLWASLGEIYKQSFFANGKEPTADFQKAFTAACALSKTTMHRATRARSNMDFSTIESFLETQTPKFFKNKSLLVLLRRANWDPDAIPDADLPLPSLIAFRRLEKIRKVRDLRTGKMVPDPNSMLLQKCLSLGIDPAGYLESRSKPSASARNINFTPELQTQMDAQLGIGSDYTHNMDEEDTAGNFVEELKLVQLELMCDINSDFLTPYSAPNYINIMIFMLMVWMQIEEALKKSNNPWVRKAYDGTMGDPRLEDQKRLTFTVYMLSRAHEEDPALCQLVADVFEKTRCGFLDNVYWGDLTTFESDSKTIETEDSPMDGVGECSIM
ncbi:hypothetical protein BJ508DRAFT_413529 [Ascobolus immersus RN42]|uniref:DUF6604 domain-containing protein n=1 Tax=Ascobolus immersus RN42 TaxID=1160509 RepID=A0A3N4IB81_ASCIM|nr:hypothetical protein BJ508DRAFT_413529 [Ascobolus immersus RN42]